MKYFTLLITFILLFGGVSLAQTNGKTITGQIRSTNDQQPVAGVTVQVKGTKNISGSQEDGIYYISVRPSDSTLVFSHPDYQTIEIRLTHEAEYNVELRKSKSH